ncbi:MAG: ABC transporter permease, partial [Actinomycetota bacterium]|nr:ABC transporter permease [Actinomycetota bacterium]
MVHYRIVPGWAAVTLPAWLLAAMIVALGAGLFVASLNVKYRDVGAVMPVLVQLWLLATPVAYPSSLVHGGWRWVYALNPMAAVVDGFRWSLLGAEAPGTEALVSVAAAIALLAFGLLYFLRTEWKFADVI